MHTWITRTGPWISMYGSPAQYPFWMVDLPRCASSLPALKNILLAIALLDDCSPPRPDDVIASQQYQRILQRYNEGIYWLTRGQDVTRLELALSAVLSWLLEVMGFNIPIAVLHLKAATRLVADLQTSNRSSRDHGEETELIHYHLPLVLDFCSGYSASVTRGQNGVTRAPTAIRTSADPFLNAIRVRRGPYTTMTPEEILSGFEHYFDFVHSQVPVGVSLAEAEGYITYWKVAVVRFRYVANIAPQVVLLFYLTMSLAQSLLPEPQDENLASAEDPTSEGLKYVLARAEDIAALDLPLYDAEIRMRLLRLIAKTVVESSMSPGLEHAAAACRLLAADTTMQDGSCQMSIWEDKSLNFETSSSSMLSTSMTPEVLGQAA